MSCLFAIPCDVWSIIGALVIPPLWWVLWRPFKFRLLVKKIINKMYSRNQDHPEVADLWSDLVTKLLGWAAWLPIIFISVNLLGWLDTQESRRGWAIGGGFIGIVGIFAGTQIINHILSGMEILLTGAFGKGDFIRCYHPHYEKGVHYEGWVREVAIYSTTVMSPTGTQYIVPNKLLMEYIIENLDRSPFHYEEFKISSEDKVGVNNIPITISSNPHLKAYIAKPSISDVAILFPNANEENWQTLVKPTAVFDVNGTATIRVPVINYSAGRALRHAIGLNEIMKTVKTHE